jgi:uncharacterized protein
MKVDLRLPESVYEMLSIYLLAAIGLKGGIQLSANATDGLLPSLSGAMALGVIIPVVAYAVLRRLGRFGTADAAAIAAHYGSVSVVTYAVALTFLDLRGVAYESYTTVILVLLEIPAIIVGILIARLRTSKVAVDYSHLTREVMLNKSVYLLVGGLAIGFLTGSERAKAVEAVMVTPFKGILAFFLLEMGIVAARRLSDLRKAGAFLVCFGIAMPLFSGVLGAAMGAWTGLSLGGTLVLSVLAASASYIAAPAAMRLAVPEANPTYYLTASLGITFPFNVTVGIPIYYAMARAMHGL